MRRAVLESREMVLSRELAEARDECSAAFYAACSGDPLADERMRRAAADFDRLQGEHEACIAALTDLDAGAVGRLDPDVETAIVGLVQLCHARGERTLGDQLSALRKQRLRRDSDLEVR